MKLISFLGPVLAAFVAGLAPLCAGAADLVVGQVAAFSGPLAPTGSHMRAGAQLYFDAVNAEGGIHGAKIRLISKDDGYKSAETVRLAREMLKESQPLAFIGFGEAARAFAGSFARGGRTTGAVFSCSATQSARARSSLSPPTAAPIHSGALEVGSVNVGSAPSQSSSPTSRSRGRRPTVGRSTPST